MKLVFFTKILSNNMSTSSSKEREIKVMYDKYKYI